jgi:hypothetical protein
MLASTLTALQLHTTLYRVFPLTDIALGLTPEAADSFTHSYLSLFPPDVSAAMPYEA